MARLYIIDAPNVALVASTAKTCIELSTASTSTALITGIRFGTDYVTTTTFGFLKVELISFTTTGTGTAFTPFAINAESQALAAVSTAKIADTVEPTGSVTVLYTFPPLIIPGGPYAESLPLGREGGFITLSKHWGVRLTSSVACNGYASLIFEE
jgi:hypothetical protein